MTLVIKAALCARLEYKSASSKSTSPMGAKDVVDWHMRGWETSCQLQTDG